MRVWLLLAIGHLPLRLLRAFAAVLGWTFWLFNTAQARTAHANLQLCLPQLPAAERRKLVRGIMVQGFMALVESTWVWAKSATQLVRLVQVQGDELLAAALKDKRGVILLSTHGASPELVSRWLGGRLHSPYTIYTPPRTNSGMSHALPVLRGRASSLKLLPTDRGAAVLRNLYQAVRDGGAALVWTDLDPVHGMGRYVPFFGQQAKTPVLPWRLQQKTGGIPLWCWCSRTSGGFKVHFRAPDAAFCEPGAEGLQAMNRDLQGIIAELGAQYFYWTYKRFRHQPPEEGAEEGAGGEG